MDKKYPNRTEPSESELVTLRAQVKKEFGKAGRVTDPMPWLATGLRGKVGKIGAAGLLEALTENLRRLLIADLEAKGSSSIQHLINYFKNPGDQWNLGPVKIVSDYIDAVSYSKRIKIIGALLSGLEQLGSSGDDAPTRKVLADVEAALRSVVAGQSLTEVLPKPAVSMANFPKWDREKTGDTAERHWEKYFARVPKTERPTMGQLTAYDKRFFEALRKHALYRDIDFDSLLVREASHRRGRQPAAPSDPVQAAAYLEAKREKERRRSAQRRKKERASRPRSSSKKSATRKKTYE